jgi:hypothetical protein
MRLFRFLAICGVAIVISVSVLAQQSLRQDDFAPYTDCKLSGGPQIVDITPLDPGISGRTVQTIAGSSTVDISDGRRIMFAYSGEDFYANVKVEFISKSDYAQSKAALIDNFDYLLASGDNVRNYQLKPKLNGFAVQGLDRLRREGGVLGFYLLIDDATRAVTTIYFLNQEPPKRFKTMKEYAALRDRFLGSYTSCIRASLERTH